jgi:hypothetical protein
MSGNGETMERLSTNWRSTPPPALYRELLTERMVRLTLCPTSLRPLPTLVWSLHARPRVD